MFDIQENLKMLPDKPGVYLHKDKMGQVIYVGKAISLKRRVRQYFQSPSGQPEKVRAMVSHIEEFEYITTDSEMEALILECNLIKKYMPKYNVLLRDDKTYPYIKVTLNEKFPRILKTRQVKHDGAKYFGPYSDVSAVNETIDLLNSLFALKRCSSQNFTDNFRVCLNYHINQCKGICAGKISQQEYAEVIEQAMDFLKGKNKSVIDLLTAKMEAESEALNFEEAARYRDQIAAIRTINEKQKVVLAGATDIDMILAAKGLGNTAHVVLFFVRDGKLSGRESYHLDAEPGTSKGDIVNSFIKQYYGPGNLVPKEVAVEENIPEQELLEKWLSNMRGSNVKIFVPQKGEKKGLLDMAHRDLMEMLKTLDDRADRYRERIDAIGAELNRFFRDHGVSVSQDKKWRIEAYDISNTNGVDSVGAMVVFENGKPQRRYYRKFRIRTVEGPNDYGSLQEVVYRRFRRAQEGDPGFNIMPELLLIDGGENQVSVVKQVLEAMKISIPVAGMVKDSKHRTRGLVFEGQELALKENPVLFKYITTIQDEVHRFAIDYHHGIRNKTVQKSVLDEIPGIGERRRNELLAHFGSIDAIKTATVEELAAVDSMNLAVAEKVKEFFLDKVRKN